MRLSLALVFAFLALALPAAAQAATITAIENPPGFTLVEYQAGAAEANDVVAERISEGVRVRDAGASIQPLGDCRADGADAICPVAENWKAFIHLGDGDDKLQWRIGRVDAYGGPGNDQVSASGAVDGGPGADRMDAHVVSYQSRTAGVDVTLDGVANDGEPGESDNAMPGATRIDGGSGADTISAAGVGDALTLLGHDGADRLVGGTGPDGLSGGAGGDVLEGAGGADRLRGDDGADELRGGADGDGDEVVGGAGSDRVFVGSGARVVMRDGERDEISCARPGATQLDLDPIDQQTDCSYAYLKFSRVKRFYTSRDGEVRVRVRCFSSLRRPCHGAVRLRLANGRTILASGPFHLLHKQADTIELKVRSAGRRLQRRRSRASVEAFAVHQVPSHPPTTSGLDSRRATWVTRRR